MHAVGGLLKHHAAVAVDDVGGDLFAAMGGQAVHKAGVRRGQLEQLAVDLELGEFGAALGTLGDVRAVSALWETAPQIVTDQPAFLNAVLALSVAPDPVGGLVARLKTIERSLGRAEGRRYGPREIDLDLLLFARSREVEVDGPVVVPHARLGERRFALAPLAELAPDARVPPTGLEVRELLQRAVDQPAERIDGGGWWKTASS